MPMIRILLAEDDTSMREYLQRALQRVGYDVDAVGCGTEAVPLLEPGRYDLLLTDQKKKKKQILCKTRA